MQDVLDHLTTLRQAQPNLRLYALADGLQYRLAHDKPLLAAPGLCALFAGTRDAALAHAGPWLVDTELADAALVADIGRLEREAPAVTWLITPLELDGLAALLRLRLDIQLPNGDEALLRFWDPRVLARLAQTLQGDQRAGFFEFVYEWYLMNEGHRAWIGREDA